MLEFRIENVPQYHPLTSNNKKSYIPYFNISLSTVITFCLNKKELSKSDIGCAPDRLIEDYLNMLIEDDETKQTIVNNEGRLNSLIWKYSNKTIFCVQAYLFNRLMNRLGFEAVEKFDFTYQTICNLLRETGLPIIINGSKKGDSVNTMIGYNAIGLKEVIVNGCVGFSDIRYPMDIFKTDGDKIHCIYFKEI